MALTRIAGVTMLVLVYVSMGASHQEPNDNDILSSNPDSEGPLLSTFQQEEYRIARDHTGAGQYSFYFSLPQQSRQEERDAQGKVQGSYAYVDPTGQEFSLFYKADEDGYVAESDSLPQAPTYTDEVAQAREDFLRYYEETAQYLRELGSEEDESDEESSEESDEESSEESDEESSEESDEESSEESDEESSEESDEESSEESDEDEEDSDESDEDSSSEEDDDDNEEEEEEEEEEYEEE